MYIKYYSVIVTQNPIRGHYYPIKTVHIASPVPQGYVFQFGGSGKIYEAFIRYTNKTVAFCSMKEDAFSKKKMSMLIN